MRRLRHCHLCSSHASGGLAQAAAVPLEAVVAVVEAEGALQLLAAVVVAAAAVVGQHFSIEWKRSPNRWLTDGGWRQSSRLLKLRVLGRRGCAVCAGASRRLRSTASG